MPIHKYFGFCATLLATFLIVTLASKAHATSTDELDTDAERGRTIALRADASDQGFGSSIAQFDMQISDASGRVSSRVLEVRTLERTASKEGDRSIVRFSSPADIAGTALLSIPGIEAPDQQWLFLPSLNRTKRISSANRSGPFVGSEFSYEDLSAQEVEQFDYRWLETAACPHGACDGVERRPRDQRSGYSHHHMLVDQSEHLLRQVVYYDRSGRKFKTLVLDEYELHAEKFWRPNRLHMINHQTGRATTLTTQSVAFAMGYTKREFHRSALTR